MRPTAPLFVVCSFLALASFPVSIFGQARDAAPAAAKPTIAKRIPFKGVPEFGEVTPMLYRGGQPSSQGFARLARFGINIVVDNGKSDKNQKLVEKLGMRYVSIPWFCAFPKDKTFAKFLKLVRNNPDKKIFVHCRFGGARTGMMIASYRMEVQGWTAEEAMQEMRAYGFRGLHILVCPRLSGYERSFPNRLSTDPVFQDLH